MTDKVWHYDWETEKLVKLDPNKPKNRCPQVSDAALCAALDEISALRLRIQDLENKSNDR